MDYTEIIDTYLKNVFEPQKAIDSIVTNIRDWFDRNGKDCKAVIGISGGKDSTILAKLCCMALGRERVVGVLMPNGQQKDISDSYLICSLLGIENYEINIDKAYQGIINEMEVVGMSKDWIRDSKITISNQTRYNLAPRLRMATLYAVSQSVNGRVLNTSNASERYIGWTTIYGDSVGDYYPLLNYTCSELIEIGKVLELPEWAVIKKPSDGLIGVTDEEKFGFTYKELDSVILFPYLDLSDSPNYESIQKMHKNSQFKRDKVEVCEHYIKKTTE